MRERWALNEKETKYNLYYLNTKVPKPNIKIVYWLFFFLYVLLVLYLSSVLRSQFCAQNNPPGHSRHITITLVTIILLFILLMTPAEIIDLVLNLRPNGDLKGNILMACFNLVNIIQAMNFSLNFLLYISLNATFRRTLISLTRKCFRLRRSFDDRSSLRTSVTSVRVRVKHNTEEIPLQKKHKTKTFAWT